MIDAALILGLLAFSTVLTFIVKQQGRSITALREDLSETNWRTLYHEDLLAYVWVDLTPEQRTRYRQRKHELSAFYGYEPEEGRPT
jgi:hypothetical protein